MAQKKKTNQTKVKKDKPRKNLSALLADAALDIAENDGWTAVDTETLARKTRQTAAAVRREFAETGDIIAFILQRLAADTTRETDGYLGDDWRDNLMEILMMRFELAAAHREAFATLPLYAARHPRLAARLGRRFYRSLCDMLMQAGLPKSPLQPAEAAVFGTIYLSIIDVWRRDETADLSKTMAAIDQRLGWFERLADFLPA